MSVCAIEVSPGSIGRMAIVEYKGQCYTAMVIDNVAGTARPKRVRVKYDVLLQDKVLMLGEYSFKGWGEDE